MWNYFADFGILLSGFLPIGRLESLKYSNEVLAKYGIVHLRFNAVTTYPAVKSVYRKWYKYHAFAVISILCYIIKFTDKLLKLNLFKNIK